MARKSDPVEALAKVLWDERRGWFYVASRGKYGPPPFELLAEEDRGLWRIMARAAIAHLKPRKTKRGAKRGK